MRNDDMIYMQDYNPETNFVWKFLDKDENVLSPESIDDLKNCSYIKQATPESWLSVSCGEDYEENDNLVTKGDKKDGFDQMFTIEPEGNDFRIATIDDNGNKMYLTTR